MSNWKYYRYFPELLSKGSEYVVIVDSDDDNKQIAKRFLGQDYPEQYPYIANAHNNICKKYKEKIKDLEDQIKDINGRSSMFNVSKQLIEESKNRIKKETLVKLLNNLSLDSVRNLLLAKLETDEGTEQIRKELNILTTLVTEDDITDEEVIEAQEKLAERMKCVKPENES